MNNRNKFAPKRKFASIPRQADKEVKENVSADEDSFFNVIDVEKCEADFHGKADHNNDAAEGCTNGCNDISHTDSDISWESDDEPSLNDLNDEPSLNDLDEPSLSDLDDEPSLTDLEDEPICNHHGEKICNHHGEEEIFKHLGEEEIFKHLGEEEIFNHLGEEEIFDHLGEEKEDHNKLSTLRTHETINGNERDETSTSTADISNIKISREESDIDTSDEEDIRNTVGNIPLNWYEDYTHIGYDWEGKKIIKPDVGDQLDYFLKRMEDPNFWRTVKDAQTGQNVILSDKDIDLIKRFESQKIPDASFNEYGPWIEWFTSEVMQMPLRKFPEHKRSFLPSKDEMRKVSKYVNSIKRGWMKTNKEIKKELKQKEKRGPEFHMLWKSDNDADEMRRIENPISAPKRPLPGHSESYNPPGEYLFNKKEKKRWELHRKSLGNKKLHFEPQKFNTLREVPAYVRYIRERFLRCLDLYMCPRAIKMRLTVEPEDLVPHLPSPKELQPFPTVTSIVYEGHTGMVRSISIDPSGQFLVSASDDLSVKFWEIATGKCLKTLKIGYAGKSVSWNPNPALCLVAVAAEREVLLINPGIGDSLICLKSDEVLDEVVVDGKETPERIKAVVQWENAKSELVENGIKIVLHHFKEVKQVEWHVKGDYFSTVMPEGENRSVLINKLSVRKSQLPFTKSKGLIQAVLFHPIRPFFFVATQRTVRIYDMLKQEVTKKLYTNSQWISSIALHPGGDNLLVGTFDRKVLWFDLDLSAKPYKTLMLHGTAVRSVAFHKRHPLFVSTGDDNCAIVSHGMVYNDLLQNALIVPLKRLTGHKVYTDYSLFDAKFHPTQPWLFTSGADASIRLYS